MKVLYKAVLLGRPIVKKNTKRVYRGGRVVYSKQWQEWEINALARLRRPEEIIDRYIGAFLQFDFKNRQAEPDTSNLIEGIQDVLEKAQIIKNDKLIKELRAVKNFDGTEKTTVILYELENA